MARGRLPSGHRTITEPQIDGFLDQMVNGLMYLGMLGDLRDAVLDKDFERATELARQPVHYRPWRELLSPGGEMWEQTKELARR